MRAVVVGAETVIGKRAVGTLISDGYTVAAISAEGEKAPEQCLPIMPGDRALAAAKEALGGPISVYVHVDGGGNAPSAEQLEQFAAQADVPQRDSTGEWAAQSQVLFVLQSNPIDHFDNPLEDGAYFDMFVSLTRRAAVGLAPRIRVNAVCPVRRGDPQWQEYSGSALKQAPRADDLAATLRFLLCAKSMTGQILSVDFDA